MSSERDERNRTEYRYYRINRILLLTMHLWPHQRSKFGIIKRSIYFTIMMSFTFFQLTSFFTLQLTMDTVIVVLSYSIPSTVYMLMYYSFYSRPDEIKQLWKDILGCWDLLRNAAERDILQRHSSACELYTILILLSLFLSLFLYLCMELSPIILDVIVPLNESRPREIHAITEYFVDEQTYYYPILGHWVVSLTVGGFVVASTGTVEMLYVEHICALFEIACYRIKHAFEYSEQDAARDSATRKDRAAARNISAAVDIHLEALKYCEFIARTFTVSYFFMIIIGMSSLTLNLYRLLRAIVVLRSTSETVNSVMFVVIHFVFIFVCHYFGQRVTDHNSEIFDVTYATQWYAAPIEIRKLLLFIMQNTTKVYMFNIGSLITASLDSFAKMSNMAISYFTIIYSLL